MTKSSGPSTLPGGHVCADLSSHSDLIGRSKVVCDKYNVSFLRYIFNKSYATNIRRDILHDNVNRDGLSDNISTQSHSHLILPGTQLWLSEPIPK